MPKRRIAFSVAALADLETIDAYISEHNPTAAARVLASIEYAISFLPDHPLMGVASRDGEGRLLVEPRYKYVVAYTLTDELERFRSNRNRKCPAGLQPLGPFPILLIQIGPKTL